MTLTFDCFSGYLLQYREQRLTIMYVTVEDAIVTRWEARFARDRMAGSGGRVFRALELLPLTALNQH